MSVGITQCRCIGWQDSIWTILKILINCRNLFRFTFRNTIKAHILLLMVEHLRIAFFEESYLIKYMTPQQIEETFLIEVERKVSADNVIRIENHDYEVHYRYAKQKLLIRYAPDLSRVLCR